MFEPSCFAIKCLFASLGVWVGASYNALDSPNWCFNGSHLAACHSHLIDSIMLLSGGRYWESWQTKSLLLEDIMGTFSKCLHYLRITSINWSSLRSGRSALSLGSIRFNRLIIHLSLPSFDRLTNVWAWRVHSHERKEDEWIESSHLIYFDKIWIESTMWPRGLGKRPFIAHYKDHQRLYIRKMLCHDRKYGQSDDN